VSNSRITPFSSATQWLAQAGYAVTKRGFGSPVSRIHTVRMRGEAPLPALWPAPPAPCSALRRCSGLVQRLLTPVLRHACICPPTDVTSGVRPRGAGRSRTSVRVRE
jgi:hypothetical protein